MIDDRSPRLVWADDGSPRSGRFGDVYFSREDGLAEARAVFLTGCDLPHAWRGRSHFTVAELGFGTGLNIVALLDLWRREGPPGGRLHIFSVEGFPLDRDEAARALSAWPELDDVSRRLLAAWPSATPGFHRLDLPDLRASLDLAVGDVARALDAWSGRADAWFLDGFAPSTNPDMWSDALLARIAVLSAPDARLATFTVAGSVRRGLAAAGFAVDKRPGHGRKRERLEARRQGSVESLPPPTVAIVGAGIAGAALARAIADLGVPVTVVEAEAPGAGASGFPAALVTPRLDAGDQEIAALYAQCLERARALYGATPGAVLADGVLQLQQAARDEARFVKIAAQDRWPADAMTFQDADACSRHLGEAIDVAGLMMRDALAVRPNAVLQDWLGRAEVIRASVAGIEREGEGWRLTDDAGRTVLRADVVVIAAGWGAAALLPGSPLAPVAGQANWIDGVAAPPVAWGGYVVPTGEGLLFGATHDRAEADPRPTPEASRRNLQTLAARLPELAARIAAAGPAMARVAVRATTPDRLPLAGAVPGAGNLFVLGGLGSRGFCAAPLLAEHVAARALGRPSPLPAGLAARVDPARFMKADGVAPRAGGADD